MILTVEFMIGLPAMVLLLSFLRRPDFQCFCLRFLPTILAGRFFRCRFENFFELFLLRFFPFFTGFAVVFFFLGFGILGSLALFGAGRRLQDSSGGLFLASLALLRGGSPEPPVPPIKVGRSRLLCLRGVKRRGFRCPNLRSCGQAGR